MKINLQKPILNFLTVVLLLSATVPALAQTPKGKKIFVITDMEGV